MGDGYFGFRLIVGIGVMIICCTILAGVLFLPQEVMQFLGNLLGEVPLFGIMFNALAGIDKQLINGSSVPISELFAIMWNCVAQNALDAFFMGILYRLVSSLRSLESKGVRRIIFGLFRLAFCTILSLILLCAMRSAPIGVLKAWLPALASIAALLIGITIMLRKNADIVIRFALHVLLSGVEAIAGTGFLCALFFLGASLRSFSLEILGWWLLSVFVFLLISLIGFVFYGLVTQDELKKD